MDNNQQKKLFKIIKNKNNFENMLNLGHNITIKEISMTTISILKLQINSMIDAFFQGKKIENPLNN